MCKGSLEIYEEEQDGLHREERRRCLTGSLGLTCRQLLRLALSRRCNMLHKDGWQPNDFEDCIFFQTLRTHFRMCKMRCQTQCPIDSLRKRFLGCMWFQVPTYRLRVEEEPMLFVPETGPSTLGTSHVRSGQPKLPTPKVFGEKRDGLIS